MQQVDQKVTNLFIGCKFLPVHVAWLLNFCLIKSFGVIHGFLPHFDFNRSFGTIFQAF